METQALTCVVDNEPISIRINYWLLSLCNITISIVKWFYKNWSCYENYISLKSMLMFYLFKEITKECFVCYWLIRYESWNIVL